MKLKDFRRIPNEIIPNIQLKQKFQNMATWEFYGLSKLIVQMYGLLLLTIKTMLRMTNHTFALTFVMPVSFYDTLL